MAITQYYVSPASGNDTTGNGSSGTPWATVQKALNTITRNATDGDQINVQAGGTDTLGAALSLATYGTPTAAAPLIIRGYTSAANDGGIGVISGGGSYAIHSAAAAYLHFRDLRLTNCGAANILALGNFCTVRDCELDTTTGNGINLNTVCEVIGCYFHDIAGRGILATNYVNIMFCHFLNGATNKFSNAIDEIASLCVVSGNVFRLDGGSNGIVCYNGALNFPRLLHNDIYSNAGTGKGILLKVNNVEVQIRNNIIQGFSGSGGIGIQISQGSAKRTVVMHNAFYNNATHISDVGTDTVSSDNVTLAAAPFVDAANGDFDINGTQAGVTEDAWPSSFLGLASTSPKADKGAVQAGAGAGGVIRRVARLMGR